MLRQLGEFYRKGGHVNMSVNEAGHDDRAARVNDVLSYRRPPFGEISDATVFNDDIPVGENGSGVHIEDIGV
jgi:hypothetical protein